MDLVVGLFQAFLVLLTSAVATRVVRRLWRHQRAVRAAFRITNEVAAEIAGLTERGEAEYSRPARTIRNLSIERLREEFPHLTRHEAEDLVSKAIQRG